jgi:DNA polymerase III delta subunit
MNNIYLFHGENNFLSQEKVKNWKKLFAEKYGDTATEVYEAKKIDWKNFSTNLQALPFLAE